MDKERKTSILRYYRRIVENQGWPWRINERWLKRTIQETRFLASYFSEGDRILDVGCGTGRHIVTFCRKGYRTIGVDISKEMLNIAKKCLLTRNIEQAELIRADAAYLPFAENSFDHAISMYNVFLELASGKERLEALRQMKRVVKTNGYIMVDLPHATLHPSWKPPGRTHEAISLEDRDFWELVLDDKGGIADRVFIHYLKCEEVRELIERAELKFIELVDRQWCDKSRRTTAIAKKT